jgi:hypothetical protein
MKKIKILLVVVIAGIMGVSCNDFLEVLPQGVVSEDDLKNSQGAEGLVTAAYASLGPLA